MLQCEDGGFAVKGWPNKGKFNAINARENKFDSDFSGTWRRGISAKLDCLPSGI
jgi:hypothetical protein